MHGDKGSCPADIVGAYNQPHGATLYRRSLSDGVNFTYIYIETTKRVS
jgi:hypothetical protein